MSEATYSALWDLQVNGGWGVSFSDADLTVEQVHALGEEYARRGVGTFFPTLISAPFNILERSLGVIEAARRRDAWVAARIRGVHLEGPWISHLDGYRGAHGAPFLRDPAVAEFDLLQRAAGGCIRIVTLAPERAGAIAFIAALAERGVLVALGHTAADGATLDTAVAAGARMSTHLGNGIATPLPRHPNPIWHQAACDELYASFIADLDHLDPATLKVLTRAKGVDRTILVSDLSPCAGMTAGRHGEWEVDARGRVVVPGTPYLAGASRPLIAGVAALVFRLGWTLRDAMRAATQTPARMLGEELREPAQLDSADRVTVELAPQRESLTIRSIIGGRAFDSEVIEVPRPIVPQQPR